MKKFIKYFICKFLFRVTYIDIENLYKYPKCIISPNHSSIFDPFFVYPMASNLYIMAKSEIFKNKLFARILRHYNVFPVDRNKRDPKSLFTALNVFKDQSEVQLLIFLEGKVVKYESDIGKSIKNGVTFIASENHIPIVPVYISRRPKLFSRVNVILGTPYFIDKVENKKEIIAESKKLLDKIYDLRRDVLKLDFCQ